MASGQEVLAIDGESIWIWSAVYSPDGRRILTANQDPESTVKAWDASGGTNLLTLLGHREWPMSVAFSPEGGRLVTGGHDEVAKIWDASTGTNLLTLKGHSGFIISASFSPDGQRVVTSSRDGTAKVWDAISGKDLLTLKGHGGWVFSAAFTPDGRRIVTASGDGVARVWEAASPERMAIWRKEEQAAAELAAAPWQGETSNRALRALDSGIGPWLVLAPLPFEGTDGARALDQEQIPHESQLRPQVGDAVRVGQVQRRWTAVPPRDHWIDFNLLTGRENRCSVAYAVAYLMSETDQHDLLLRVGSDDQAKIFLNGTPIYRQTEPRSGLVDQDQVTGIELKAGLNILVFKIVNETRDWGGSVRFTDAAGRPAAGIQTVVAPPGSKAASSPSP